MEVPIPILPPLNIAAKLFVAPDGALTIKPYALLTVPPLITEFPLINNAVDVEIVTFAPAIGAPVKLYAFAFVRVATEVDAYVAAFCRN